MPPKFSTYDLWESKADLIAVTTNGTLKDDGSLVMGKGAAKEAADRVSHDFGITLPLNIGAALTKAHRIDGCLLYGFYVYTERPINYRLGLFQTKLHWRKASTRAIIGYSIMHLKLWLAVNHGDSGATVALNFPGIGAGELEVQQVFPLLLDLPENVTIHFQRGNFDGTLYAVAQEFDKYYGASKVKKYVETDDPNFLALYE